MLSKRTHFCLLLGSATLSSASPLARRQAQTYGRMIVFGDSYSDDGNGAWVASNHTWPADPAYYNHSFSNGPKWSNDLADTLSVELLNYAAGGATADNSFVQGYTGAESTIPVPSTRDQIATFLNTSSPRPDDLFVHWIGANDALCDTNITGAELTSLINRDVDTLFRAGARTILFANYPPVNQFPATYGSSDYAFADDYAKGVDTGLGNLVAGYSAYIKTGFIDVQALFANITNNPAAYGVDEKYVNPPTACLQGAYPSEGVPRSLCDDPERHLYFDPYHPVKEVHTRISQLFQEKLAELAG
ncbi:carbohydrate esterase family 16 protein [Zasmidium cellare ATCC 36951]|uniref:Carbohydrate esterase family 16 protein n=1 Tax=Zasmidium cellare ATCC 36951 TaxID=1080233 RepID=A0A6A6CKW3_ZASCE|nr:carbohydrate esterase family 16 protein [Zasmidium cellare ATCC 36951]KAF2166056.1 carbohydrate esterase family 16 protein [Zasmidium cellare ATCC 36951]